MAQEGTIVVRGLGPLIRDFSKLSKEASRDLRERLRKIAVPVAIDARFREEPYGAKEARGIRVVVRQRGVEVEQTLRKTAVESKRRVNFGELQMRKVLIPALEDNAAAVDRRLDEFLNEFTGGL
jgi:hypothetical protein